MLWWQVMSSSIDFPCSMAHKVSFLNVIALYTKEINPPIAFVMINVDINKKQQARIELAYARYR